jgi:hypothetical protein
MSEWLIPILSCTLSCAFGILTYHFIFVKNLPKISKAEMEKYVERVVTFLNSDCSITPGHYLHIKGRELLQGLLVSTGCVCSKFEQRVEGENFWVCQSCGFSGTWSECCDHKKESELDQIIKEVVSVQD